jgi:hypothetical protein
MNSDTYRQNARAFLATIPPATLLGITALTRAENFGGRNGNDLNSEWEQSRSENGRSCVGRCAIPPRNTNL